MKISEKIRKMTDKELAEALFELSNVVGENGMENAKDIETWLNLEAEEK